MDAEPATQPPREKIAGDCARRYCKDAITTRQEAITYQGDDYHRDCAMEQLADDRVIEFTDGATILDRKRRDYALNRRGA